MVLMEFKYFLKCYASYYIYVHRYTCVPSILNTPPTSLPTLVVLLFLATNLLLAALGRRQICFASKHGYQTLLFRPVSASLPSLSPTHILFRLYFCNKFECVAR